MLYLFLNGATKSYIRHYSCVVIILFSMGFYKSAFSSYSFKKLDFPLSVIPDFVCCRFFVKDFLYICVIIVYITTAL